MKRSFFISTRKVRKKQLKLNVSNILFKINEKKYTHRCVLDLVKIILECFRRRDPNNILHLQRPLTGYLILIVLTFLGKFLQNQAIQSKLSKNNQ